MVKNTHHFASSRYAVFMRLFLREVSKPFGFTTHFKHPKTLLISNLKQRSTFHSKNHHKYMDLYTKYMQIAGYVGTNFNKSDTATSHSASRSNQQCELHARACAAHVSSMEEASSVNIICTNFISWTARNTKLQKKYGIILYNSGSFHSIVIN